MTRRPTAISPYSVRKYFAATHRHRPSMRFAEEQGRILTVLDPAMRQRRTTRGRTAVASVTVRGSGGVGLDLATMAGAGEVLAEIEDVSPPPTIGGAVPNSQHGERASPLCGRWAGAWLAVVSLLAVAVYWLIKDSLIDDSYITLGYARNLAVHFHWGLIPQETANSATSPLNVLLLAALMDLLRISG